MNILWDVASLFMPSARLTWNEQVLKVQYAAMMLREGAAYMHRIKLTRESCLADYSQRQSITDNCSYNPQ